MASILNIKKPSYWEVFEGFNLDNLLKDTNLLIDDKKSDAWFEMPLWGRLVVMMNPEIISKVVIKNKDGFNNCYLVIIITAIPAGVFFTTNARFTSCPDIN